MRQTDDPNTPRAHLPSVLTSFIGRVREQDDLLRLLAASRLVTLTGTAGCGKTRVALQVTTAARPRFADGVYWITLAQLEDPRLVTQFVAKAVGAVDQPDLPLLDSLLYILRDKQLLLVLDNC